MPFLLEIRGALQYLDRLQEGLRPRPLLQLIGLRLLSFIDRKFATAGAAAGGPSWAPLRPSTLEQRKRGGDAPLQDSGFYRQSFTMQVEEPNSVWVGSRVPYGEYQEYGTRPYEIVATRAKVLAAQLRAGGWAVFGKRVHHPGLPARPVLPDPSAIERFIESETQNYLEHVLGQR